MEDKRNEEKLEREMTGEEIERLMKQIEESAEDIRVPESLEPESVKARLRTHRRVRRTIPVRRLSQTAAVVALVALMGGVSYVMNQSGEEGADSGAGSAEMEVAEESLDAGAEPEQAKKVIPTKKEEVGSYRLAANYREVFETVAANGGNERYILFNDMEDTAGTVDGGIAEQETKKESEQALNSGATGDFSKTNLQVEGVDESDFIKNDGSYLYVQTADEVYVVDIRGDEMKTVATLAPELGTADSIREMYLDGDRLFLIVEKRDTSLEEDAAADSEGDTFGGAESDVAYVVEDNVSVELQTYDISNRGGGRLLGAVSQDGSYYDSRKVGNYVYLFTREYPDTSARVNDTGETKQGEWSASEGSGPIGLTEQSVPEEDDSAQGEPEDAAATGADGEPGTTGTEEEISETDDADSNYEAVIPSVGGKLASADCIYVQDGASCELIVSSVDTEQPEKIVDYMVLVNNYAEIHMSTEAIYLYAADYWESGESHTDIAKFSYRDGILNGVGATSLRGTIQDTFAISEGNGVLRVLTTEWSSYSENRLYLLDENLKELGSLKGIAEGEEVYAARYIGDTAYFITYHNTDPLFAVDISDPANPEMLGQVEITGFSDYLHPYGDGLLLGIGYETDPDTSERLGVKLVMFDISDPLKLKILDTVTLDGDYTSAADDYKSVLADAGKNLIGFQTSGWREETEEYVARYFLYSWENGKFVKRLGVKMGEEVGYWGESRFRGLYAGNRFYLVNPKGSGYRIRSYDMDADCGKLDEVVVD